MPPATDPSAIFAAVADQLPPAAQRIVAAGSPRPVRLLAARGVAPGLKPADVVAVIALLAEQDDEGVAETARSSLAALPPPILTGALASDLEPFVISALLRANLRREDVVEALVRMPRIETAALEEAAAVGSERVTELIATNEARLLMSPSVIVKLYKNPRTRMSTADRLVDLAGRNNVELDLPIFRELVEALKDQLIPEPDEEASFDDVVFREAAGRAAEVQVDPKAEDTHEVDEEGVETPVKKLLPLYAALAELPLSGKIRRAMIGSAAERMILVRDTNRLVARAAIKSEMIQEPEIVRISASRQISADILTEIAKKPDWIKNNQVKLNLVANPRTPFTYVSKLLPYLQEHDVRSLSRSKSVPGAVQTLARQQLSRKGK